MEPVRAVVVTVSDRVSRGEAEDRSGPAAVAKLAEFGIEGAAVVVVEDGVESVRDVLQDLIVDHDLIVTTGGTGFTPRDLTPEGSRLVIDREAPGLAEAMRAATFGKVPHGMLSRGVSGIAGSTLIINLPGSVKAVQESLDVVGPALHHGVELLIEGQSDHNT
ncbi:MAG: MogA/MoaB family molybdenum cofactor biosynthesis protein [bacterium]|nr:MogA/MoaB family molybdenum cofactor biosynthesis protein [bacterium]MCP4968581.1 MogA/MoaB family molybdenum cofactor biosynthesis protein [bacterium]